jgi:predicted subunit of tRNA(5-methylaminomethyl-2-thiouridylate) methyltransferase
VHTEFKIEELGEHNHTSPEAMEYLNKPKRGLSDEVKLISAGFIKDDKKGGKKFASEITLVNDQRIRDGLEPIEVPSHSQINSLVSYTKKLKYGPSSAVTLGDIEAYINVCVLIIHFEFEIIICFSNRSTLLKNRAI